MDAERFLAYPNEKTNFIRFFFVDTPPPQPNKDLDFFSILNDYGSEKQEFHMGLGSVAVPGNTAGLLTVHKRLEKLTLRTVLEPAIETERKGVFLNESQGYIIQILAPFLNHTSAGKKLFTSEGEIIKEGDNFKNPSFADFLEELILHGPNLFYKGLGEKLILETIGTKGLLTSVCLDNYEVIERTPLKINFLDKTEKDLPSTGATTQVSIIDKAGNAFSVTTTNGERCGYLISELGIMLNNMLGEEDPTPSGFHNFVKQQRLPTIISPSLVMGNDCPELVVGSGRSNRIRSANLKVILNYFMKEMNLEEAIRSPRIHLEGDVFHCEPGIKIPGSNELPNGVQIHKWDEEFIFRWCQCGNSNRSCG